MSDDLKPCPVCGGTDIEVSVEVECMNRDCQFFTHWPHWQALPRTRWVSVEGRLPKPRTWELFPVQYLDSDNEIQKTWAYHSMKKEWREPARYGSFVLDRVTHWLENLPALPPAQQEPETLDKSEGEERWEEVDL